MKADYFSEDIIEFISLLTEHEVKYLIVGGEAVIYYGYLRLTGDVDFFYSSDDDNVPGLFNALLEFWNDNVPGIDQKEELKKDGYVIQFGVPPNRIDLMNSIDGVDFEEAWVNMKSENLETSSKTIPIYYLGLEQLIKNKKASGRDKDHDDLSYLIKIR